MTNEQIRADREKKLLAIFEPRWKRITRSWAKKNNKNGLLYLVGIFPALGLNYIVFSVLLNILVENFYMFI